MARRSVRPVAHGVDVGVRFERDEQMTQAVFQAPFCGRGELYAPPRRALAGARHPPHAARGTAPPGPAARPKPAVGFPTVGPGQSAAPRGAGGSDPSAEPRNRASRVSHTGSGLTGVTNCRSLRRVMRPRGLQKTAAVGMFVVSVAAVMRSPRSVAWEQSRRGSRGSFSRRAARVRRRDARRCGWTGSLPARPGRRECRRAAPQASAGSTRPAVEGERHVLFGRLPGVFVRGSSRVALGRLSAVPGTPRRCPRGTSADRRPRGVPPQGSTRSPGAECPGSLMYAGPPRRRASASLACPESRTPGGRRRPDRRRWSGPGGYRAPSSAIECCGALAVDMTHPAGGQGRVRTSSVGRTHSMRYWLPSSSSRVLSAVRAVRGPCDPGTGPAHRVLP